jgi:hypothetical protein
VAQQLIAESERKRALLQEEAKTIRKEHEMTKEEIAAHWREQKEKAKLK